MTVIDGDIVRYVQGGPRTAKWGCVGVAAAPSEKGQRRGWLRAGFSGSYDDYAPDELELAQFWVLKAWSNRWALGPFPTWDEAKSALAHHIRQTIEHGDHHPLNAEQDKLLSQVTESGPSAVGREFVSEVGSFVIKPGGIDQPKQYDDKGQAYA